MESRAFIVSERVVCVFSSPHQDDRQVGSGAQVPSLREVCLPCGAGVCCRQKTIPQTMHSMSGAGLQQSVNSKVNQQTRGLQFLWLMPHFTLCPEGVWPRPRRETIEERRLRE